MRAPASERPLGRRTAAAAALALVLVVPAAGCGDDGQAKRDYVKRAGGICTAGAVAAADVARRTAAAQRGSDPDVVFSQLATLTEEAVRTAQPVLDQVAALAPPSGDEDKLKAWLTDLRRRQSLRRALAEAFADRDETAISTLSQRIATLGVSTAAFATRYGLRPCARVAG